MNRREFLTLGACAAAAKCMADAVPEVDLGSLTVDDFRKAVSTLEKTSFRDVNARKAALEVIQKYVYAMKSGVHYEEFFKGGCSLPEDKVHRVHEEFPVLWWYDHAFAKVLGELKDTEIKGDVPAVWYVYNMGVVVKTRTCAFAIDLCHRKACEMIPYLDFAMISHNHGDHFTPQFLSGMRKAKKPCFTNFDLNWDSYVAQDKTFELKGVKIHVTRTDHNVHLPLAVNCHEIECGGENPFVIFHSGDSHKASQIRTKNASPDLFFGHCAIGFSFPEAYKTTMPAKLMLTVHHQELGHLGGRWRCVGFHEEPERIRREFEKNGKADAVAMPVWGDRIV